MHIRYNFGVNWKLSQKCCHISHSYRKPAGRVVSLKKLQLARELFPAFPIGGVLCFPHLKLLNQKEKSVNDESLLTLNISSETLDASNNSEILLPFITQDQLEKSSQSVKDLSMVLNVDLPDWRITETNVSDVSEH